MFCYFLLKILVIFLQNTSIDVFACSLASASFFYWMVTADAGVKELRQYRSNKNAQS